MNEQAQRSATSNPIRASARARFTVFHRHGIRIEDDPAGRFVDAPSLFAVTRQPPAVEFTVTRHGAELVLDTGAIELRYRDDGRPLGPGNLSAWIRHGTRQDEWRPGQANPGNLGGTAETLDQWTGPRRLPDGLLSRDGWFLLDDSTGPLLQDGWVASRGPRGRDWYLFGYGGDYRAAFQAFAAVAGPVPLPRRYTLGAWYSRYWPYRSDDYRQIVREYAARDFPLDLIVMDMDWHLTQVPGAQTWTGYTWDRELLPDAEALLAWLHREGLHVTLNDHPAEGVQPHEAMYAAFMKALGGEPDGKAQVPFDAADRHYLETFYRHTHEPLEASGVDFWWLDWQQDRRTRSLPDVSNLPWLNHYYYQRSRHGGRRGQSFSRWGGWGDHRHPIHFSGDAATNWAMLACEVPFTATAGNVGCFFWSHDIGGHLGERNEEAYARWCQFGALSAALRSHSTRAADLDRRPWTYPAWAEQSMHRSFHLRAELFPHLYSCAVQACRDNVPMLRPMYLDDPETEAAYHQPQQYRLGDHFVVAPIAEAGSGPRRLACQAVWFPPGLWFNVFTGERFEGPSEQLVAADIDEFPLYVRGGVPLATQPYTARMGTAPLTRLCLRCWPGVAGQTQHSELEEDDGLTEGYLRGDYARTRLSCTCDGDRITVTIAPTKGRFTGQPVQRQCLLDLAGIEAPQAVTVDGHPVAANYDAATRTVRVDAGTRSIRSGCTFVVHARSAAPTGAAAAAFARRVGLPAPAPGATVAQLFAAAVAAGDSDQVNAAQCAAGIGVFAKHETAYGFPDEPDYFIYTPAGFRLGSQAQLQLGDVHGRQDLTGERTRVDLRCLTDQLTPPANELLFPTAAVPLTVTISVGDRPLRSRRPIAFTKPYWPFRENLAPRACVTASSAMEDQPPSGAIDGVVGGIPGNRYHEWASRHERAGAWLKLEWPATVTVGRILLFDRPNHADHVVAGRILLDDGTVLDVGELPANGQTPLELCFPARPVRWLLFLVTEVSATTGWVGLAEIGVYPH